MNTFFAKNMGNTERIARISGGVIIVLVTLLYFSQLATWLALLLLAGGATLVVEGILAWCPVRAFLGLGTQHHRQ